MYWVIKKPVITEKSKTAELDRVYTFIIDSRATKVDVSEAIERLYGVKVLSVNVLNTREKFKFGKNRNLIRKKGVEKKALVKVEKPIANLTKVK